MAGLKFRYESHPFDCQDKSWDLVAMNDVSWRRGIWMKLMPDETLLIRSGREGHDVYAEIPAPFGSLVEDVLATGRWMCESYIETCEHGVPMYHVPFAASGCMRRGGWNDHEAVTWRHWSSYNRHLADEFSDSLEAGW